MDTFLLFKYKRLVKFSSIFLDFWSVWPEQMSAQNVWKWSRWCLGAGEGSHLDQDGAWNQGSGFAPQLSNMLPANGTFKSSFTVTIWIVD